MDRYLLSNTEINSDKYLYEELPAIGVNLYEVLQAIGVNQIANDNVLIEMISSLQVWNNRQRCSDLVLFIPLYVRSYLQYGRISQQKII